MNLRSWWSHIIGGKTRDKKGLSAATTWNGYSPTFSSVKNDIFLNDLILQAVRLKADFISKLDPRHILTENGKQQRVDDTSIARVLRDPNPYMTTKDFLEKAAFIREVAFNTFIFPDYYWTKGGYKYYTGLYIIQPQRWRYLEDEETGELYIGFTIAGRKEEVIFKYSEIIHWRKNFEEDTYDGGGKYEKAAQHDLLNSLQAYRTICESIAETAKCGCFFDGIVKVNAYGGEDENVKKIRDKFIEDVRNGESGVGVLDNGAEWQDVKRNLRIVDANTLTHFQKLILRHTGVSLALLEGDFTTAQKEAFYERCIESGIISLGQAFTKCVFTRWQKSHGNEIVFYPNKIELMSTTEKVALVTATSAAGIFTRNEVREMFGKPPVEGGDDIPRGYNNLDSGKTQTEEEPTEKPKADDDKTNNEGGTDNGTGAAKAE